MKKKLETSSIMNELQEGSAFFRDHTPSPAPATRSKQALPTTTPATSTKKSEQIPNTTQNRTVERSDRTKSPNGDMDNTHSTSSVLTSIDDPQDEDKRLTERYSFEIYTDQKEVINDAKYLYYKKTGRKVSSSELIRDALDIFLTRLMKKLED